MKINFNDPVEQGDSLAKIAVYLLCSEVEDFVSLECPRNHIFVDAVIAGRLWESKEGSVSNKISVITNELVEEFNEDKGDDLISLAKSYEMDYTKLLDDF